MANKNEKSKTISEIMSDIAEQLIRELPDGIERNKLLIIQTAKEINGKKCNIVDWVLRDCGDPKKVEDILNEFQRIYRDLSVISEVNGIPEEKDEEDTEPALFKRPMDE